MDDIVTKIIADQEALRNKIDEKAKEKHLSSKKLSPIYDGVADVKAYIHSSTKIMWILKEPYDCINEKTKEPEGGGWILMKDLMKHKKYPLKKSLPRTLQRVIYSTFGIITGEEYENMAYYYQPEMYEYLFQIADINLSKMPAGTRSEDMTEKYYIWKDLIFEQISLYNPDVIILGNTFQYMRADFLVSEKDQIFQEKGWVDVYKKDHRLLVDAYHPGIICSTKQYVNTLVSAIHHSINHLN